jgi:hypothetical protein
MRRLVAAAAAVVGCVGGGSLGEHPDGSNGSIGGATGSGTGAGGSSAVAASCSEPPGRVEPYTAAADLEARIAGDWLHCSGSGFPAAYGAALRISPDHTWNALQVDGAGNLQPITTGDSGYGTWSVTDATTTNAQFILHFPDGGGAYYFPAFTDNGQMDLDPGGLPTIYARLGAGGLGGSGGSAAGAGGAGGAIGGTGGSDAPPANCGLPTGQEVPCTTVSALEGLVEGDWLHCSGSAYPAAYGIGIRIAPDHTWNALQTDSAGNLQVISTGSDGYGTWSAAAEEPGHIRFDLLRSTGGGMGYFPVFTDAGRMDLDPGGVSTQYVRTGLQSGAP